MSSEEIEERMRWIVNVDKFSPEELAYIQVKALLGIELQLQIFNDFAADSK